MAQATANPEQQSAQQGNRPAQTEAVRTYQKVKLTETTEDELRCLVRWSIGSSHWRG